MDIYDDFPVDEPLRFLPPNGEEWNPVNEWSDREWEHWLLEHNRYKFLKQWTPDEIAQYLLVDRYKYGIGFGTEAEGEKTWFYQPTPVAVPFHACKIPNILFGGAAGGTKSHSARHDAYRHCLAIPEFRAIIMRRTFEELKRNHLDKARSECERMNAFLGEEIFHFIGGEHEIRINCHGRGRESKILFGHCQNSGDEEKYLGDSYDAFYPDEMATFERKQIIGVAGRLRSEKRGIVARLAGTSNPGGAHTLWLKEWFIDKNERAIREENPRYRANRYHFLPAMLYDNPYYMDPDGTFQNYEERLFSYDPERRKQLLLGDWTALSGQFFPEFSYRHVAELSIPPGCKIERWLDWGYDPHYGICLWVACLPNGRLYVFYEYKFNGAQAKQKMVASEVAAKIRTYTLDEVLPMVKSRRITKSLCDPSMESGDGHSGEDYVETFRRAGVSLTCGDNERIMGWGRVRHWLRNAPDGMPWIMFHPRCVTTIRTIPGLVRDKSDPDDIDTDGEDHPADACFLASTMIETARGAVPIASLTLADHVMTRRGWRPVDAVFRVGERATLTVRAGNRELTGTPDHKIWTENGWKRLQDLRYGDILRSWSIPTNIGAPPVGYGDDSMAQSRQNIISTIRMAIRRITHPRTWNVFRPSSIYRRMGEFTNASAKSAPFVKSPLQASPSSDSALITANLSGGGIWATMKRFVCAPAATSLSVIASIPPDIAHGPVAAVTTCDQDSNQSARGVGINSNPEGQPSGALLVVESVTPGPFVEVFNLTVQEIHEYYANGILVANCRYGVMARPTPTVMKTESPIVIAGTFAEIMQQMRGETVRQMGMVS